MKKLLLLISLVLIGCSSLELGDALSSEQYTQRILDLGLSHDENLKEASKLKTPHLVSVVSLQLTNARDEKIQNESDFAESVKLAKLVKISNNNLSFIGSEISESIKTGVLAEDFDKHSYFLEGYKDSSNSIIQHKLHVSIFHNSKNKRDYFSANACDQWGRCEDAKEDGTNNKLKLKALTSNASNCTSYRCDYAEVIEIELSDVFLKNSLKKGLTIRLFSKKKNHKILISKAYLLGYLSIAQ